MPPMTFRDFHKAARECCAAAESPVVSRFEYKSGPLNSQGGGSIEASTACRTEQGPLDQRPGLFSTFKVKAPAHPGHFGMDEFTVESRAEVGTPVKAQSSFGMFLGGGSKSQPAQAHVYRSTTQFSHDGFIPGIKIVGWIQQPLSTLIGGRHGGLQGVKDKTLMPTKLTIGAERSTQAATVKGSVSSAVGEFPFTSFEGEAICRLGRFGVTLGATTKGTYRPGALVPLKSTINVGGALQRPSGASVAFQALRNFRFFSVSACHPTSKSFSIAAYHGFNAAHSRTNTMVGLSFADGEGRMTQRFGLKLPDAVQMDWKRATLRFGSVLRPKGGVNSTIETTVECPLTSPLDCKVGMVYKYA